MSCYLKNNVSQFNPEGKFKFSGESMNQLDYENHGDFGSTDIMQHQLFRDFNFFTKKNRSAKNNKVYIRFKYTMYIYSR